MVDELLTFRLLFSHGNHASILNLVGGDSKTLMFVQISPSDQDSSETLSSLNFATRVRGVELGPVRKQIDTAELQKMKVMVCTEIPLRVLFCVMY